MHVCIFLLFHVKDTKKTHKLLFVTSVKSTSKGNKHVIEPTETLNIFLKKNS